MHSGRTWISLEQGPPHARLHQLILLLLLEPLLLLGRLLLELPFRLLLLLFELLRLLLATQLGLAQPLLAGLWLFLTLQFRLLLSSRVMLARLGPAVLQLLPNSLPILLLLLMRLERLLVLRSCRTATGICLQAALIPLLFLKLSRRLWQVSPIVTIRLAKGQRLIRSCLWSFDARFLDSLDYRAGVFGAVAEVSPPRFKFLDHVNPRPAGQIAVAREMMLHL
jgi:hypothetical protein